MFTIVPARIGTDRAVQSSTVGNDSLRDRNVVFHGMTVSKHLGRIQRVARTQMRRKNMKGGRGL